jgi:peptidoglycan/xylan/chitin deacetylase (PgdA/CDA1 family)
VRATFFSTGQVAERYPDLITQLFRARHELGCHGHSHRRFDHMAPDEAKRELVCARSVLERFDPAIASFRAPNLQLPRAYLGLLASHGFRVDSSLAAYKPPFARDPRREAGVTRIPVTLTSSVLRLPLGLLKTLLAPARAPVLFLHPWELVDLRSAPIRYDCRFRTGAAARHNLSAIIRWLKARGYRFRTIGELAAALALQSAG